MKFKRKPLDKNGNTIWDYVWLVILLIVIVKIIEILPF